MTFNITEFQELINNFYKLMLETKDSQSSVKLADDKWTLKEMLGHLIDSASNNHQRFVRLQVEEKLIYPSYDAETWKDIEQVNYLDLKLLIELWKKYNDFILHIITIVPEESLNNQWIKYEENPTLEFLINDYFRHLKWHLDLYNERLKEIQDKYLA